MPLDQAIASFGAFIPFIRTKLDVVLFNVLPFNVLKGLVIDMMLWDDKGIYFLTAKGKEFYRQVMEQQFIAVSATKGKVLSQ